MANSVSVCVGDSDTMRCGASPPAVSSGAVVAAASAVGSVAVAVSVVSVVAVSGVADVASLAAGATVVAAVSGSSSPQAAANSVRPAIAPASHGFTATCASKWLEVKKPAASPRTALASRVWLSHAGPGDRTRPHPPPVGVAASPLRVSAGISPDFAGSCDRTATLARGDAPVHSAAVAAAVASVTEPPRSLARGLARLTSPSCSAARAAARARSPSRSGGATRAVSRSWPRRRRSTATSPSASPATAPSARRGRRSRSRSTSPARCARAGDDLVIVDCLTLWVNNLLHRGDADADIEALSRSTAAAAADRPGRTVVISNEVGLGVHPETELGRRYRDLLGRVNQHWAQAADVALLLVAGRAVAAHRSLDVPAMTRLHELLARPADRRRRVGRGGARAGRPDPAPERRARLARRARRVDRRLAPHGPTPRRATRSA